MISQWTFNLSKNVVMLVNLRDQLDAGIYFKGKNDLIQVYEYL